MPSDVFFVRNKDYGIAGLPKIPEQGHDIMTRLRVKISRWLVSKDYGRGCDDRSCDGNPLTLAP